MQTVQMTVVSILISSPISFWVCQQPILEFKVAGTVPVPSTFGFGENLVFTQAADGTTERACYF